MGRIPGPRPNIAVVYPFLQETPLGRLTELPGDEGYKISMPCGRTEFKRKLNKVKPRRQLSRVPASVNASRLHTVFLFGTIAQEAYSVEVTKEIFKRVFFMGSRKKIYVTLYD